MLSFEWTELDTACDPRVKIPVCRRSASAMDVYAGARISARRNRLGMSHDELARAVRISRRMLRSYEAGTVRPMPAELCTIAMALGVPISCFFDRIDQSPSETGVIIRPSSNG
jgi:DNA-binding transcriptional regulator YiaG